MASLQLLSFFRNGDKIVSYLLYCILNSPKTQSHVALVGVDGQPVFLLSNDGLSATVSKIQHPHISYNISWLLAYKQVIEAFHNDLAIGGVIPMRYGYLFKERSQVIQVLKKSRVEYISLLKELEGCVEMGIRILISDSAKKRNSKLETPWPRPAMPGASDGRTDMEQQQKQEKIQITSHLPIPSRSRDGEGGRNSKLETPGKAYLAARKANYAQEEKFNKQVEQVIERCRALFSGLFVKCKTEVPSIADFQFSIHNPFPSIYFLIQRESIAAFRRAFRQLSKNETARLLLSGPWPPYNFAQPEHITKDIK
jgi:hypothetical protein